MIAEGTDRRALAATVYDAAEAVVAVLRDHPLRGSSPYPVSAVLPTLDAQLAVLQGAVGGWSGPLLVNAAGKQAPLVEDLAALMSFLQLVHVLFHGLDDVPDWLRVSASRSLSTVHLIARRVRDEARREAG